MNIFSYPSVIRGLAMLMMAGAIIPISGVHLMSLNLIPFRFMMMHGALLGGVIGLIMGIDPIFTVLGINIILAVLTTGLARSLRADAGKFSAFLMVITLGIAFLLIYKFRVSAKDTFSILWGSLYTIKPLEFILMALFLGFVLIFQIINKNKISSVIYNPDIAHSVGINSNRMLFSITIISAVTVSIAMKIVGALLLDAILLLPALVAIYFSKSIRSTFITAGILGVVFALSGFGVSLGADIPVSSAIAIIAGTVFFIVYIYRTIIRRSREKI